MPDRCLAAYIAYVGGLCSLSQEMNARFKAANLRLSLTGVGRSEPVELCAARMSTLDLFC
jgi:hypothetical protein